LSKSVFSNVYPNPASNQISFDYAFPAEVRSAGIQLSNMLGQKVKFMEINPASQKVTLSVSDLNEGLYFYTLLINNQVAKTNKIILQR